MQVGVIGGSGFYKLEELENTKEITVFDSSICKLIPGSGVFVVFGIVFIEWGSNITTHY